MESDHSEEEEELVQNLFQDTLNSLAQIEEIEQKLYQEIWCHPTDNESLEVIHTF